jgi:hypothetical protein
MIVALTPIATFSAMNAAQYMMWILARRVVLPMHLTLWKASMGIKLPGRRFHFLEFAQSALKIRGNKALGHNNNLQTKCLGFFRGILLLLLPLM